VKTGGTGFICVTVLDSRFKLAPFVDVMNAHETFSANFDDPLAVQATATSKPPTRSEAKKILSLAAERAWLTLLIGKTSLTLLTVIIS